MGDSKILDVIP